MLNEVNRMGVSLRIPPDLKKWLDQRAEDNGRSLNGEIVQIIRAERSRAEQQERV